VVATKTLNGDGTYQTSETLYDSLLRPRETQKSTLNGGRVVTDTSYDSHGWVVKSAGPFYTTGAPDNTIVQSTDGEVPTQTATVYDGVGRKTTQIAETKATETWRASYVYGGNYTTTIAPPGGKTYSTLTDARGRTTDLLTYHSGVAADPADPPADNDRTHTTWTPDGKQATVTDPLGNVWSNQYDLLGHTVQTKDPDTGTTTSVYDNAGQLLSSTDAANTTISYTYDLDGRKTATYNTTGGAAETGTNELASWTYDTLKPGLPSSSTAYYNGNAYTTAVIGYDTYGNSRGTKLTLPAAEGALAIAGGYVSQDYYNPIGTLNHTIDSAAGGLPQETINYGYDSYDRPNAIRGTWNYVDSVAYTEYDEPQLYEFPTAPSGDIQVKLSYDAQTHRLATEQTNASSAANPVDKVTYGYDPAGQVTSIDDVQDGTATDTQCFGYDYTQRLTQAWTATDNCTTAPSTQDNSMVGGPLPYWQSWTFDAVGDRLTETDHDTSGATVNDTTTTYTYPTSGATSDQPHALATTTTTGPTGTSNLTYHYNDTGDTSSIASTGQGAKASTSSANTRTAGQPATPHAVSADQPQSLTWTPQGNLATDTTSAGTTTYLYDADGNLLLRKDPGRTTLFVGDEQITLDTTTNHLTGARYYSLGTATVAVMTSANDGSAPTIDFLVPDRQGTDTLAIDYTTQQVTRREYTPYGQPRGTTPTTWPGDRGYVGGTPDPTTGLENLGAREYDPNTGRFLDPDPLFAPGDAQQMGGYSYAADNPVTDSDPTGKMYIGDNGIGYGTEQQVDEANTVYEAEQIVGRPLNPGSSDHDQTIIYSVIAILAKLPEMGITSFKITVDLGATGRNDNRIPGAERNGKGTDGFADIILWTNSTIWIWEVKSRSKKNMALGPTQLGRYVDKLQGVEDAEGTGRTVMKGFWLDTQVAASVSDRGKIFRIWSDEPDDALTNPQQGVRFYGPVQDPKPKKQTQEQPQQQPQSQPCTGLMPACTGGFYPGVAPDNPGLRAPKWTPKWSPRWSWPWGPEPALP
jgi:RHS repeat-associated protein